MLRSAAISVLLLALCAATLGSVAPLQAVSNSDRAVARLKANGLNPNDPNLTAELKALAVLRLRAYRPPSLHRSLTTWSGSFPGLSLAALNAQAKGHWSRSAAGGVGSAQRYYLTPPPVAAVSPGINPGILAKFPHVTSIVYSMPPGEAAVVVNGSNLKPTDASLPSLAVDTGTCGVWKFSADSSSNISDSAISNIVLKGGWAVDQDPKAVNGTLTVSGVDSNTVSFTVPRAWLFGDTWVSIGALAPRLSQDDQLGYLPGLAEGTNVVYSSNADRISYDPFHGSEVTGQDSIARGISYVNGGWVEAKVESAHSYQDAPNYTVPDDANRGATIVMQPGANGRMETRVAWHYLPGESISYTVRFRVHGFAYMRPLTIMQLEGFCTTEQ